MHNKKKRILWLINHTTLRESEVPLLISLGYEVYTPKCIPSIIYDWSGSVDFSYDKTLTIPQDALEILNHHNFYEDPMPSAVATIVNQYFSAAFCIFYPTALDHITQQFNGEILLRAFGLEKNSSYSSILDLSLGHNFSKRLRAIGDRFWFSQAYSNLHEVEAPAMRLRKVDHPIGLPSRMLNAPRQWTGGVNKLLFFCPRINIAKEYYGAIYKKFKKQFGDIPHTIAGNQPVAVKDPCVAGFQPRETLEEWFQTYAVMFYHSEEPRHLHYHPLEAIAYGMPLIFMKKGILGQLSQREQPGACDTIAEARTKLLRVLRGDKELIAAIRQQQKELLNSFTPEYCRQEWQKNFVEKIMTKSLPVSTQKKRKTIGVFLPIGYRGGSLAGAKNIAKMIHMGSRAAGEPVHVIFSCVARTYNIREEFDDLLSMGILVHETEWQILPKRKVAQINQLIRERHTLHHTEYLAPKHGVSDFHECDFWFIISDRLSHPLVPFKPYGIMVYDYIQRYIPQILPVSDNPYIKLAREANFVLTTTPSTREDAIQYAGLHPSRTYLAPMEFDPFNLTPYASKFQDDYFIWPTNISIHKNHLIALKALSIYYSELAGKFKVIMTGVNTDSLRNKELPNDNPYSSQIMQIIKQDSHLKKNLIIAGNLQPQNYINTLASAKFLWHPTTIDNGTYSVIEAAYYNVPSLSSDYPQMLYINERFKLNLSFCRSNNAHNIALQLKELEKNHENKRQLLPAKDFLDQFNYANTAPEFWRLIRSLI